MNPVFDLSKKIALVTGGNRGIGRAICFALAEAGATVLFTYQSNADQAKAVVQQIIQKGGHAVAYQMDVKSRQSVKQLMHEIDNSLGGIDILVNNAGINKPTDFDKIEDEDWDEILAVNLKGPFVCMQEALPLLIKRGGGSIVNIGSISGQYGGPRTAHYAVSKAGLISLGQVAARFGAEYKIRCNTIAAGLIESEMAASGLQSQSVANVAKGILLQKLGKANDVANAVVFLASEASAYITAQTINVNGGLYF